MKQTEDNVTTMFETTAANLQTYNSVWSGMPAFADAVGRVEDGIAVIRQRQAKQAATGDTDAKQTARDAVEEQTFMIGSQLSAWASKNKDDMLAAKVNFDKSTLDKAALSDLMIAAQAVQTAANANAAILASDYQISATDLTTFGAAITKLGEMKDAPRSAVVNKRVATLSLPEAIKYVRGIYRNEIDKMLERFKKTAPDFYAAHFAARVIIDRPGSRPGKPEPPPAPQPKS